MNRPLAHSLGCRKDEQRTASSLFARENKILREENALLKRGLFGRRSERIEPGQLAFFDEVPDLEPLEAPAKPAAKPKKKPGHGRAPFPEHLPRETIECDLAEKDRACKDCGKPALSKN